MTEKTTLLTWLELKFEEFEKNGGQVILRDSAGVSRSSRISCRPSRAKKWGTTEGRVIEMLAANVAHERIYDLVGCSRATLARCIARRAGKAWALPPPTKRRAMIGKRSAAV